MNEILYFNSQYLGYLWLIISVIFLLAEVTTPGLFFFIAFAMGSLVAAILAFLEFSFVAQCLIGLGVSLFAFWILRHFFAARSHGKAIKTNVEALVGKNGLVVKNIEPTVFGQVKIEGEIWAAESLDGKSLRKGTLVRVEKVVGNRLLVKE
jgi:membrane protein implicated in regulation of membrane protease activity